MCDEANSFLTEENSSLVSILSETVVFKQFLIFSMIHYLE